MSTKWDLTPEGLSEARRMLREIIAEFDTEMLARPNGLDTAAQWLEDEGKGLGTVDQNKAALALLAMDDRR